MVNIYKAYILKLFDDSFNSLYKPICYSKSHPIVCLAPMIYFSITDCHESITAYVNGSPQYCLLWPIVSIAIDSIDLEINFTGNVLVDWYIVCCQAIETKTQLGQAQFSQTFWHFLVMGGREC